MPKLNVARSAVMAAACLIGDLGVYAAFIIGYGNGLLHSIDKGLKRQQIAGCPAPFKMNYTSFAPIDSWLQTVLPFFCAAIDGEQSWGVTLSNWYLAGQIVTAWSILSLEGLRAGNKGRPPSWITAVGMIFQAASYTFTVPLYVVLHLVFSPIGEDAADLVADHVVADAADIDLIPISVILSLVIPSVLMALPTPSVVSATTHYNLMALWQPFPLWHAMIFSTFKFLLRWTRKRVQPGPAARKAHLKSAAHVYRFALAFAVLTHLSVLAIALTPSSAVPDEWASLFHEVDLSAILPGSITSPPTIDYSGDIIPDALAPLAAYFLKFDVNCGNIAMVIWAFYLHQTASPRLSTLSTIIKVVFWTLVGGASAPLVVLLWERDEMLLGQTSVKRA